jgi:hypothetical protein
LEFTDRGRKGMRGAFLEGEVIDEGEEGCGTAGKKTDMRIA